MLSNDCGRGFNLTTFHHWQEMRRRHDECGQRLSHEDEFAAANGSAISLKLRMMSVELKGNKLSAFSYLIFSQSRTCEWSDNPCWNYM